MKSCSNKSSAAILTQLNAWYSSNLGISVFQAEQKELEKFLSTMFGGHLLQLGGPDNSQFTESSSILHRIYFTTDAQINFAGPIVQGNFSRLPFLFESVDVILLPHVLEFIDDLDSFLQQIFFALIPGGRVIILGFNPFSLWGIEKIIHTHSIPWAGKFHSAHKICNKLKQNGFYIENQSSFYFRPASQNKVLLKTLLFFEPLGKILWSGFGAINLIVAEKRVAPLLPIHSFAFKKKATAKTILEPTAKVRF